MTRHALRALWGAAGLGIAGAYLLGLGLDVMEVDAAQYAAISRHLAGTEGWLELTDRGEPFLNKPPLLFWASALSFTLLGVSNVAYKLPSFLVFLLGAFSVYQLAARYGGPRAGRWSALALVTCQGAFHMNQDVRTDTVLLGLVAFSLWQAARFLDRPRASTAAWLGLGLGAAFLAKGPIGVAVPLLGVAAHVAAARRWRRLLRPEWLVVGAAAALPLVPMVVGVVRQHGLEGLRFHLWTQGPGRVFGENIWGDEHGPLFFVPQLLWTLLPWTLFFGIALWHRLSDLGRSGWRLDERDEALTLGAFALAFVGLSLSRSKLPHYIYVTLPATAVITGSWIAARLERAGERGPAAREPAWPRGLLGAQRAVLVGVWLVAGALVAWAFPPDSPAPWIALVGFAALALPGLVPSGRRAARPAFLLAASVLTIAGANLALNGHVYPKLLAYQASGAAGRLIADRDPRPAALVVFRRRDHALDFYAGETAVRVEELAGLREAVAAAAEGGGGAVWGFAGEELWETVRDSDLGAEPVAEYASFPVSKLTGRFLDPRTRDDATSLRILFRIAPAGRTGSAASGR